jgi:two-component system response regulator HydG
MPATLDSICILDDDSSVPHSLQQLLDSDGFAARTFDDAEKFLAHAQEHAVKLAVLDIWMPGMTGIEVQEQLHALSPDTRVIVMTGRDDPGLHAAAREGGALAFLIKPFDDEAFLALVRSVLREAA